MLKNVLLLMLFIRGGSFALKSCDDCVGYLSCEGAVYAKKLRWSVAVRLLRESVCGHETYKGKIIEKVCCSDFMDSRLELLPRECGIRYTSSIGQGRMTNPYEFPWMALIAQTTATGRTSFQCAGTIINVYYVLTAAHCVHNQRVGVRVGDHDYYQSNDCVWDYSGMYCESHIQDIEVAKITVHDGYRPTKQPTPHDIALLRLRDRIEFNDRNVAPICLPIVRELQEDGIWNRRALVAGWGETETGRMSNILLKVSIPVLGDRECKDFCRNNYPSKYLENKICAGARHQDTCNGDSGGPLMAEKAYTDEYRFVQYGIVSSGDKRCGSGVPALYTDVSKYIDWILERIELH